MAARWGRSQTAEALLTLGADVMAKDCDGLSPVDHAWYYKVLLHFVQSITRYFKYYYSRVQIT